MDTNQVPQAPANPASPAPTIPVSPDVQTSSGGNSKKIMIISLIILVVLILAGGGYMYYLNMNQQSTKSPAQTNTGAFDDIKNELESIDVGASESDLNEIDKDLQEL